MKTFAIVLVALFAVMAVVTAQAKPESQEALKGAEAVYVASPYGYGASPYAYGAAPYAYAASPYAYGASPYAGYAGRAGIYSAGVYPATGYSSHYYG